MGSKGDDPSKGDNPLKEEEKFYDPYSYDNDPNYKQPIDPPKVIYHGPYGAGLPIPEEMRRVFGTPPPPNTKRPVPPPPLPPNSYHKKPKYWQTRGTSYMQPINRMAGVLALGMFGICYLLFRFNGAPERWSRRLGYSMSMEEKFEYDKKNELYWQMITQGVPETAFEVTTTGEYRNPRRKDNTLRWDLREIDRRMIGIKEMGNPMDDPL